MTAAAQFPEAELLEDFKPKQEWYDGLEKKGIRVKTAESTDMVKCATKHFQQVACGVDVTCVIRLLSNSKHEEAVQELKRHIPALHSSLYESIVRYSEITNVHNIVLGIGSRVELGRIFQVVRFTYLLDDATDFDKRLSDSVRKEEEAHLDEGIEGLSIQS